MDGNRRIKKPMGDKGQILKLIISLYDETFNSVKGTDKQKAEKCLELWDIMFERQWGSVREISRKLMERKLLEIGNCYIGMRN